MLKERIIREQARSSFAKIIDGLSTVLNDPSIAEYLLYVFANRPQNRRELERTPMYDRYATTSAYQLKKLRESGLVTKIGPLLTTRQGMLVAYAIIEAVKNYDTLPSELKQLKELLRRYGRLKNLL